MRGEDGLCPIADKAPVLLPANQLANQIFVQAQYSAQQVAAEDKTYMYLRITDIESLMRMYDVEPGDRISLLDKVQTLQNISNNKRPKNRKKK